MRFDGLLSAAAMDVAKMPARPALIKVLTRDRASEEGKGGRRGDGDGGGGNGGGGSSGGGGAEGDGGESGGAGGKGRHGGGGGNGMKWKANEGGEGSGGRGVMNSAPQSASVQVSMLRTPEQWLSQHMPDSSS